MNDFPAARSSKVLLLRFCSFFSCQRVARFRGKLHECEGPWHCLACARSFHTTYSGSESHSHTKSIVSPLPVLEVFVGNSVVFFPPPPLLVKLCRWVINMPRSLIHYGVVVLLGCVAGRLLQSDKQIGVANGLC